jgi:riboflavin biosynthesis pyrimidine reductase
MATTAKRTAATRSGSPATLPDRPVRPRVITHNLASADGRLAVSPGILLMVDDRWPVSDPDPYTDVKRRHHPDALLEGSGSFVTDDETSASLPSAGSDAGDLRQDFLPAAVLARATAGWLVVPDSRGRVRWGYKEYPGEEWAGWHLMVLVSQVTPASYLAYLRREAIPYLVAGHGRVDLAAALERLAGLGVRTVVSTGGGRLNGALLRAGLVDAVEVEVVPMLVGGEDTPALFTARDLRPGEAPTALRLEAVEQRPDGRVLLRWSVPR